VFIERSGNILAKRVVQRLDGIWDEQTERHKNKNIRSRYQNCDAIVWQSEFDKNYVTNLWGEPKYGTVIRNGVEMVRVQNLTSPELIEIRKRYKKIYVCSSAWHGQKRLKSNVELFNLLQ
jgi:hypothetical protein